MKFSRQRYQGFTISSPPPNFKNIICGQFGHWVCLALYPCAVAHLIAVVLAACSPREIGYVVVSRIAVDVSALHSFGARSDEHFEHQDVDEYVPYLFCVSKHYLVIAIAISCGYLLAGFTPRKGCRPVFLANGQHLTKLVNRITRIVSDYTKTDGDARILVRHALFLENRVLLRSSRGFQDCASFVFMKGAL